MTTLLVQLLVTELANWPTLTQGIWRNLKKVKGKGGEAINSAAREMT